MKRVLLQIATNQDALMCLDVAACVECKQLQGELRFYEY